MQKKEKKKKKKISLQMNIDSQEYLPEGLKSNFRLQRRRQDQDRQHRPAETR